MKILIVYGTTEGQTRKISMHMEKCIEENGHIAVLHDSTSFPIALNVAAYDAVIVAASLHQNRYQAPIVQFIEENLEVLTDRPTAFISVSLSAVFDDDREDAQKCLDMLLDQTGWAPTRTEHVAGALVYTQYDFFKRQIMKFIVKKGGGPTDASQDYEFTDWDALDAFVKAFVQTAGALTDKTDEGDLPVSA